MERTGPYDVGAVERFVLHVDPSVISRVDWSATAGSLTASGFNATWKLPDAKTAVLTAKTSRVDGSSGVVTWQLALAPAMASSRAPRRPRRPCSRCPLPVFDGGSLDVSGGACEVRYEGTTSNVAIAFTTVTHPSLMYGRWNGSTWTLEVVDALGFGTGGLVGQHVSMRVEANGTPHLAYVRDSVPFYATKQGGVWLRERVDASLPTNGATGLPSVALNGSTPVVLYDSFLSGTGTRPVLATRTGANTWSATVLTGSTGFIVGDLAIDGAGRATFPLYSGISNVQLASVVLPATTMQFVSLFGANNTPARIDHRVGQQQSPAGQVEQHRHRRRRQRYVCVVNAGQEHHRTRHSRCRRHRVGRCGEPARRVAPARHNA